MTIAAALLGTAAGDVLGAPVEGRRGPLSDLPDPDGVHTDDTQQALVLAYHLLSRPTVDPASLAFDLAALAHPGATMGVYRGAGSGFRAFIEALSDGAAPDEAAQPSAGNGAAMRTAPVAVRFAADPALMLEQAVAAALVTHADPRGAAAAVAQTAAIAAAAAGAVGRDLVYTAAEAAVEAEHRMFADAVTQLGPNDSWHTFSDALQAGAELVGAASAEIARSVGARAARTSASRREDGTDAYAGASVVTAIVLAAPAGDEVEQVRTAVSLGGDADTIGAMVGAITGARSGRREWPWRIVAADLCLDVGDRLATGGDAAGLPDLYDWERGLG